MICSSLVTLQHRVFSFAYRRAPLEEMLQRAGVGPNNRGPTVS
jgi:hypothetical protein